jgi:hypothetical protein
MIELPEQSPNHYVNSTHTKPGTTPCVICGRGVKVTEPHFDLILMMGNMVVRSEEEAEADEMQRLGKVIGDYGAHPIGSDCLRRHPELKEYAIRSEGW